MRKTLRRVRPEDFDVKQLLAAAREGRLYVDESGHNVNKEQVAKEVRAYVARIRALATPEYRLSVDEVWNRMLDDDAFADFFMPGTKARRCTLFNKYNVMRVIGVLREKGVYEMLDDSTYNGYLEQNIGDTPYRKYLSKGIENHQRRLLLTIRNILTDCKI